MQLKGWHDDFASLQRFNSKTNVVLVLILRYGGSHWLIPWLLASFKQSIKHVVRVAHAVTYELLVSFAVSVIISFLLRTRRRLFAIFHFLHQGLALYRLSTGQLFAELLNFSLVR